MADMAIKIRGLKKSFGAFTLGPIDLNVPKGAIYGLIGPNGAGKTTAIDLMMALLKKDAGTIEILGMDHLKQEAECKAEIGYVSPDINFNAWGTVRRLVNFFREFYPSWDDDYCDELMRRMNVNPHDEISKLSYGTSTKLNVVLALAHRPALLLLDEPLAGLDAVSKKEEFTELLSVVRDEERTVLISSHDLHDIERFSDHVGIIHKGRILVEGPTDDIVQRYRIIDAVGQDGAQPNALPGVRVQQRDGNRWRLLVTIEDNTRARLESAGFTDLNDTPVTLEDLLVALVKE